MYNREILPGESFRPCFHPILLWENFLSCEFFCPVSMITHNLWWSLQHGWNFTPLYISIRQVHIAGLGKTLQMYIWYNRNTDPRYIKLFPKTRTPPLKSRQHFSTVQNALTKRESAVTLNRASCTYEYKWEHWERPQTDPYFFSSSQHTTWHLCKNNAPHSIKTLHHSQIFYVQKLKKQNTFFLNHTLNCTLDWSRPLPFHHCTQLWSG